MAEAARKKASYDDLFSIPENMLGEIVDGELVVTPRPSARHMNVEFALSGELAPAYRFGRGGGPGGWIILPETEIMLGEHLLVPDLAGWRKGRFPGAPKENWISVSPDWVCEILSPNTIRVDKVKKMPIYARHGVAYLWLIDPTARTLDVFKLESSKWFMQAAFTENDKARAEPFLEVEIELDNLWLD